MECLPSQCAYTSDSVVNSDGLESIFKCSFVDEESTNEKDMPTNRGFGCSSLALVLVCYGDQDGFLVGMTTEGGYVLDGQLETLGLVTQTSFVGTNFECGLGLGCCCSH